MAFELEVYTLNLKERRGKSEQVKAIDVGLMYNSEEELKKFKDSQNPFTWILTYFNTKGFKLSVKITYNEKLLEERIDALLKKGVEIDLELADCYIKSQYHSKSQKIIDVKDTLNSYLTSKITYTLGKDKKILDSSIINSWIWVDENFQVVVDQEQVEAYIDILGEKYHTTGRTKNFITSSGETIHIGGGNFSDRLIKPKKHRV